MEKLGQEYRRRASPVQCHIPIPFRDRGMNLLNTTYLTSANRSWSALAHIRSRSPAENVPTLDQSLPPPGHAGVLAPPPFLRLPTGSARRSNAPRPAWILPASAGSGPPSWPPVAPAPCDSDENTPLLLPLRPSRALRRGCRTPTQNPNVIGRR